MSSVSGIDPGLHEFSLLFRLFDCLCGDTGQSPGAQDIEVRRGDGEDSVLESKIEVCVSCPLRCRRLPHCGRRAPTIEQRLDDSNDLLSSDWSRCP